ncbi:MAG: hypothetical protein MIO93_13850, partial [ANME-2 cluster archaeon]|nr:hypothetical protein [ANME-2 cluster archaeon]
MVEQVCAHVIITIIQDSKQQTVLLKYTKTLYYHQYGDSYWRALKHKRERQTTRTLEVNKIYVPLR